MILAARYLLWFLWFVFFGGYIIWGTYGYPVHQVFRSGGGHYDPAGLMPVIGCSYPRVYFSGFSLGQQHGAPGGGVYPVWPGQFPAGNSSPNEDPPLPTIVPAGMMHVSASMIALSGSVTFPAPASALQMPTADTEHPRVQGKRSLASLFHLYHRLSITIYTTINTTSRIAIIINTSIKLVAPSPL